MARTAVPTEPAAPAPGGLPRGFASYEEFWPHYVGEHGDPRTRALHFVGTTLGLLLLLAAALLGNAWLLLAALVAAYGLAWVGHFFVEKNRPATFSHPLWSLRGDLRMYALTCRGRMGAEVQRLRLGDASDPQP